MAAAPRTTVDVESVLGSVPLFASLAADELGDLAASSATRTFAREEVVFREGEEATSCFVVVSGEVEVSTEPLVGATTRVRRLGPGEVVGEIGVLVGRARTATVTATRATTALELPADELRRAITANPLALEQVSQLLAARLVATNRGDRPSTTPRVIVLTGEPGVKGRSLVAASLAALLQDLTGRPTAWIELVDQGGRVDGSGAPEAITPAALVDAPIDVGADLGTPIGDGGARHVRVHVPAAADAGVLAEAVERLRARFTFVVVDPATSTPTSHVTEIGDAVVHVSHRLSLPPAAPGARRHVVLNLFDDRAHDVPVNHNEPFVLRRDGAATQIGAHEIAEHLRTETRGPTARTLRRLVRTLLGTTVGVALGGGAAFGLAHVGVLHVLDDHDVPVDLIVGTSMGSIVATGYAAGIDSTEMHDIAERVGRSFLTFAGLLDLNPLTPGVLSGRRLQRTFNPLLGSAETFDDLVVPCQTVAADIESGQRVCIGTGRLEDAFRASSSVPMLFGPWIHDGRILVDGAMVDPVPAEVSREMGADLVIAVNVVPHLRKGVTNVISRVTRGIGSLNPLTIGRHRGLPGFVDTAMNSIQSLQHELGHFKAASADVRINPDLADVTWIEFYRASLIIERGQEAATEALPAIQRVLAERLAAALPT